MPPPITQAEFETRLDAGSVDLRLDPLRAQPIPAAWLQKWCTEKSPVATAINVAGAVFDGDCCLNYLEFKQPVFFTECEFQGALHLEFTAFRQASGFSYCTFRSDLVARHLAADSDFGFCLSRSDQTVQLDAADVKGDFDARGARFQTLRLLRARIGGSALFTPFDCRSRPDWNALPAASPWVETEIAVLADLAACTIGQDVTLWGVRLSGELRSESAQIGRNILFTTPDHASDPALAYTGASRIEGPLGLSKCTGQTLSLSGLSLRSIDLSGASFSRVRFEGSVFQAEAEFSGASLGDAFFTSAQFPAWTDPISGAVADAGFEYVSFRFADFRGARFGRPASFGLAKFAEPVLFRTQDKLAAAQFASTADFTGVCAPHCDFSAVVFQGSLKMPLLSVPGLATFAGATFQNESDFTQSNLGSVVFAGATFAQTADFEGARFGSAEFWDKDKKDKPASFDKICLSGCEFTRIHIDADTVADKQHPLDFQPILRLEKSLRADGDERGADDVYYRFCVRRNREMRATVSTGLLRMAKLHFRDIRARDARREVLPYLEDCLFWLVCRYGVRPYRLAVYWLGLLILGTLVLAQSGVLALKDDKTGHALAAIGLPAAFGQALTLLLPGASLAVGQRYVPTQAPLPFPFAWVSVEAFVSVLQIAAWILVPIGVLSLSGLLHRKKD